MRQNADNFLYSNILGRTSKKNHPVAKEGCRTSLTHKRKYPSAKHVQGKPLFQNPRSWPGPKGPRDCSCRQTVWSRPGVQGLSHHPVHILNSPTVQFTATVDRIYTSNPGDWPKKHSYEPLPTAHIGLIIYQYMQQGILSKRVSTVSHQPSPQCPCRPHCHSSARSRRHSSKSCPLSRSSNSTCKKMVRLARSPEETY